MAVVQFEIFYDYTDILMMIAFNWFTIANPPKFSNYE